MSQYFPKPYEPFRGDINVKVDLSNYATKADIKNISHIDTSSFVLKTNLTNLKTEVDNLDIDKLAPVPVNLSKLIDAVNHDVVKKDVYDRLSNLNRKITKNKTYHLLVRNEFKKLKTFDSSYFISKIYFEEDGTQNYLYYIYKSVFYYPIS